MRAALVDSPGRTLVVGLLAALLVVATWNFVAGYYGAVMVTAIGAFLAASFLYLVDF